MSQLTRKLFKLFCANKVSTPTDNIGIFGSKKAGASAWSSDPDSIQSAHYLNGWTDAVVSNQAPCMDDMNALQYVFSYMIKYLYQTGIPEWLSTEEYYQYSFVRYNGYVWISVYNGQNTDTPQDSSTKWKRLSLPRVWIAGSTYNVGDLISYNGKTYRCVVGNTADSLFETDFYSGKWDDGNPAGTLIHNIAWQKTTLPYHYFDVTGSDAGRELPISSYNNLYSVIGQYYKNANDYTTYPFTSYPDPASGNFRLPDFRNTFFKNSGSSPSGQGHNASHTHSHNRTSSINLTHSHNLADDNSSSNVVVPSAVVGGYWHWVRKFMNTAQDNSLWTWTVDVGKYTTTTRTQSANLLVPALSLQNQGSGSTPEPNYYGTRILIKY